MSNTNADQASWALWGGKFATTRELLGQIGFLVGQEHEINAEIAKYQSYAKWHLPHADEMLKAAQDRLAQVTQQSDYYCSLLDQYKKQGNAV